MGHRAEELAAKSGRKLSASQKPASEPPNAVLKSSAGGERVCSATRPGIICPGVLQGLYAAPQHFYWTSFTVLHRDKPLAPAVRSRSLRAFSMDQTTKALTIDLQAFDTSALHTRLGELRRYL